MGFLKPPVAKKERPDRRRTRYASVCRSSRRKRWTDKCLGDYMTYSSGIAFELYKLFLQGVATENHVILYLRRFAIIRMVERYWYLGRPVCEDLSQTCSLKIIKLVRDHRLPLDSSDSFQYYLMRCLNECIGLSFAKEIYDDASKLIPAENLIRCYLSQYGRYKQVEDDLFIDEVPEMLISEISSHCRFVDGKYRRAIAYVIKCLVCGRRVVDTWIKRNYDVNPAFIVEHAMVRIRMALYELKKCLSDRAIHQDLLTMSFSVSDSIADACKRASEPFRGRWKFATLYSDRAAHRQD